MKLELGKFSPDVKIGLVSASRNCFPRSLSEKRTKAVLELAKKQNISLFIPDGACAIIESKQHAIDAAAQMKAAGCHGAVLYLGNFSPEIEDANFVKQLGLPVALLAAAEESQSTLAQDRGDALCGLLSAVMAIEKRGLRRSVYIPADPIVDASGAVEEIKKFTKIVKVYTGIKNATIGLFGPRPRDFETCNYNVASVASLGIEIEELALFDLANEIKTVKDQDVKIIIDAMKKELSSSPSEDFLFRLAVYEKAVLNYRDRLSLSAMTTQCWSEQELSLKHVPCYINARMASKGFPIACENDTYSLISELFGQYATDSSVTILDINHSIPIDLDKSISNIPNSDLVGLFHCGNTDLKRLKNPQMKYQLIMKRLMEPDGNPDITRGTIEGQIAASPMTLIQIHGSGDKVRAYLAEGEFLDLDPKTFGATGTAYIPGFRRFYRQALLGKFHHHAAVAFDHCGQTLYEAFKMLGIDEIYTPLKDQQSYQDENPFSA